MRTTLTLIFALFNVSKIVGTINGIVWSKKIQNFVPIFSIESFSTAKSEYVAKIGSVEYHNFNREALIISYYQETNIVSFIDNDTKITGACGEIWTTLADYLNFTLIPIKMQDKGFGNKYENGSYDGLLGLIQRNESQVIPRAGAFADRTSIVEYTMPLWTIRYYLYVTPDWKYDEKWMFHLFSTKLWCCVFGALLVLSFAAYSYEKVATRYAKEPLRCNLQDHIVYTIAIASSQGSVPPEVHNKSRLIYVCTSMFSWIILIAFSSHAIFLMMNRKFVLPFGGLKELIQKTKYDVLAFNGSMVHQEFENKVSRYLKHSRDLQRIRYAPGARELYERACFSKKRKYAVFEAVDRHRAIGKHICPKLVPSWESYFETWIASAIKAGFPYKRSFDVGIIKMIEFGLIDGLKARWLEWKPENSRETPFQSIDMDQVYLIFGIWVVGFTASIFLLFVENLLVLMRNIRCCRRKAKRAWPPIVVKTKVLGRRDKPVFFVTDYY